MEKIFKIYDSINTTAVRILYYNSTKYNKPLGIKNFSKNNIYHMWLLRMMENYTVYNNYNVYYIDGNIFTYLYLRYIKNFKYIRHKTKKIDAVMIDVGTFVDEIMSYFDKPTHIIEDIYNAYWR